tara:strand:+ start:1138 stop:2256 length:1119 start_codon:yes stop_codon:yes gene_type:complete
MKKDVYPDVRIEIVSEGLRKKILEQSTGGAPVVYGEEKPKGENLPNIDSKGKNKEMGGLLQVSNKKPTYTAMIKQAILELRKDAHEEEGRSATPLRRSGEVKQQVLRTQSQQGPSSSSLNRRPEVFTPPAKETGAGEGMGAGTSSPLTQSDAVKRQNIGGGTTGTSTRTMDPASAPPGGRDFDMSRGPGKKAGLNPKDLVPGGTSFAENAIVKEVVSEFLNKGKVWDVQKETWVTKQAPPMTTSATKPANMGVGMQQPVVSGAGSMKNIDKAKVNKEPAPAAKRKTAPRPRKNIQAAIIKAAGLALEKARGKQGRSIPKSRQFKQSDLGRGATTFNETTERRSKGGRAIPKSRQFSQKPKRATGGMAETYRG